MTGTHHGNSVYSLSESIRQAYKGAVDLILPYKCAVCGSVSDTDERFGEYSRLYEEMSVFA